ncbi:hypothetical protein C8A01DRAFT_14164 [Parachaetomium inaequale]|uniref:DUF1772 domain-containing protein n=1 Tax=Parachaetomium inaequale TaxID=2588326 RepID=A0AAN6PNR3_9PEZI|nr:hypothetical protein C8A01DRAFT_14164 [Parachaetomium inaequale]
MASHQDTTLRLTQGTALLLSTLSSGVSLTLSTFLVPRLLESPTPLMLTQWRRTYTRGASTVPFAAVAAAAGYIYLGLRTPGLGLCRSRLYLAAAALTVGIAPYTQLVMGGTNGELKRLEQRAAVEAEMVELPAEVIAEEERGAKALVDWWGVLNLGRTGLLVGGAVCALVATL